MINSCITVDNICVALRKSKLAICVKIPKSNMEGTNKVGRNENTHCPGNPFISGIQELSALKVTVIQQVNEV